MKTVLLIMLLLTMLLTQAGCVEQRSPGSSTTTKSATSPVDIPRKPESLAVSEAEYFLIYVTYANWGWDFTTRYNSAAAKFLAANSTSWWMGNTDDENKRLNYTKAGNQWIIELLPALPAELPPKPPSLAGSDADYYFLLSLYDGWFGKGSFESDYNTGVKSALNNSWVRFWIGSADDASKRANFISSGDQWLPRAFASTLLGAINYTGLYPEPANVSYTNNDGEPLSVLAYPGQIEVFFSTSTTASAAQNLIKAKNGTILGQLPMVGYYLVEVSTGMENAFINIMSNDAGVSSASPNIPVSASEEGVSINTEFITSSKPIPLNVKPGIIALDYYLNETHGFKVNESVLKNGGTVGSSVEIGTAPGGSTTSDKVKMAIIAAAEGNRIFNPGEPTLFNLSTNHGVNQDFNTLTIEQQQSLLNGWEGFTQGIAQTISALPTDIKDNVALINSAGNTRMPLNEPLANLRKDPYLKDILDRHFLFVSTTLRGKQTLNYPWGEFSNYAPGDFDVAVINNLKAIDGTSFASPAAAAIIQQVKKKTGISLQDTLQAVKTAVSLNAKHELVLKEAIREANLLNKTETSTPTPSPSPVITPSPTPESIDTPSSVEASVTIDSMSYKLLNSQYDSQGYYWVEISASGTASGPIDAIMFLSRDASHIAFHDEGWLPVLPSGSWTQLENGRMIKRENSADLLTGWSAIGNIPITWTQWYNWPDIELTFNAEVQSQHGETLATATYSIPLEQPAQAR
ncbi:hypothetical protein ACFLWI_06490 [Chloroflexota bacterium]